MDEVRVDRWLWAVRLYKTRSLATEACRGGHVRVNRSPAKAATAVQPGDSVVAFAQGRERLLEVTRVVDKRVGAAVAAECYRDHTPVAASKDDLAPPVFARKPSAGRPTKRDRRQLDRLRSR